MGRIATAKSRQHEFVLPVVALLVVCLSACEARITPGPSDSARPAPASSSSARRVTFVQMTDPHLFDAGSARHGEGVEEEALDNRAALHWAVLETNRLVLVERQAVDFVVITGDFGLDNVVMPPMPGAAHDKCECPKRAPGKQGPIVAVPLEEAAAEVARELRALVVKQVFLVPGNNDLCHESPRDVHRWAEFVHAVKAAVHEQTEARKDALTGSHPAHRDLVQAPEPPVITDLTYSLERLYKANHPRITTLFTNTSGPGPVSDQTIKINGVSLLGLNSAYFKPHADKALQTASDAESGQEMAFVSKRIQPGGTYAIFTHILDLQDPHRTDTSVATAVAQLSPPAPAASAWQLTAETRKVWREKILERSEVLGVFGGHFHSNNRDLYPHNFGYAKTDQIVADKMWLAPPLAAKYQVTNPPAKMARGMLLVTLTTSGALRVAPPGADGVKAIPLWFSTLDQVAAIEGDRALREARAEEAAGNWEQAATLYAQALASGDSRARASAALGYEQARAQVRTWWWQIGRFFPPLRWLVLYPVRTIAFLPVTIVVVVAFLLVFAGFRKVRFLGIGVLMRKLVTPRYRGRARLNPTAKLTADAPSDVFAARLLATGVEIRDRLRREQTSWMAGHVSLLAPSSASITALASSLPSIPKVDVSQWIKFAVQVGDALRWNVDTGVALFHVDGAPSAVTAGDAKLLPERGTLSGYAVLQWGWLVKNQWRETLTYSEHRGQSCLEDLARRLSEQILGEAFV